MSNTAITIVFGISALLSVAWVMLTVFQTAKRKNAMERELYLKELEKMARENEQYMKAAERAELDTEE